MSGAHILVIKLGALGDFVQALGPMAAIRRHHPGDRITLLTTAPFAALGQACGYADDVAVDRRPRWYDAGGWLALRRFLNGGGFSRVYDLQNNDRTSLYMRLFSKRPEWVGAARGASHRNASKARTAGTALAGHIQTLALAGIRDTGIDDLGWVSADIARFSLPARYALLVPGSAPQHPRKRWPAAHYGALACHLAGTGVTPVVLGTAAEKECMQEIRRACPQTRDLSGQTDFLDIIALARGAACAVGNDTGPMHLIAPTGCPSLVLFSDASNPARHAPAGARVRTLVRGDLALLSPEEVRDHLHSLPEDVAGQ